LGTLLIDKINYIRRDIHKEIIYPHPGAGIIYIIEKHSMFTCKFKRFDASCVRNV